MLLCHTLCFITQKSSYTLKQHIANLHPAKIKVIKKYCRQILSRTRVPARPHTAHHTPRHQGTYQQLPTVAPSITTRACCLCCLSLIYLSLCVLLAARQAD